MAVFISLHSGFSKSAWKSMFDETGDPLTIFVFAALPSG